MEENNNIDKYTAKILKHLELEKPSVNFTEKIMDKVLFEQTQVKKAEAFNTQKFFLIFTTVFISILLLAILLPSGTNVMPEGLNTAKDILGNFQIDFSFIPESIFSSLKNNTVLKILPLSIIALVIFERLLLKYSDNWKA